MKRRCDCRETAERVTKSKTKDISESLSLSIPIWMCSRGEIKLFVIQGFWKLAQTI